MAYERFHIETKPAPNVYKPTPKFDVSAKKLRLAAMLVHEAFEYRFKKDVVLSRPCIYVVFGGRLGGFKPIREKCVGCMRCVQEYPHIMTVKPSDEYGRLGDSYWTPDSVFTILYEASTGKISVKGMGYKGSLGGEGFDGMWTHMSEIVRPTRDGVYGREYISTVADIGRKATSVNFGKIDHAPSTVDVPVPIIFDDLPALEFDVWNAVGKAARTLGSFFINHDQTRGEDYRERMIPIADDNSIDETLELKPGIIEYDGERSDLFEKLSDSLPSSIVIARVPLREEAGLVACKLAREGVHGLHLYADYHGQDYSEDPKHISESLKEVHQLLVKEGLRDQVTIIASGGITLAEHVPKAIICGADLVGIDTTVLVALQAEFLGETQKRGTYKLRPRKIDPAWGTQRLVNLFGVWHDQLIEILSAMGMRDVRRLRGDIGRSMMDAELREQSFKGIAWAT